MRFWKKTASKKGFESLESVQEVGRSDGPPEHLAKPATNGTHVYVQPLTEDALRQQQKQIARQQLSQLQQHVKRLQEASSQYSASVASSNPEDRTDQESCADSHLRALRLPPIHSAFPSHLPSPMNSGREANAAALQRLRAAARGEPVPGNSAMANNNGGIALRQLLSQQNQHHQHHHHHEVADVEVDVDDADCNYDAGEWDGDMRDDASGRSGVSMTSQMSDLAVHHRRMMAREAALRNAKVEHTPVGMDVEVNNLPSSMELQHAEMQDSFESNFTQLGGNGMLAVAKQDHHTGVQAPIGVQGVPLQAQRGASLTPPLARSLPPPNTASGKYKNIKHLNAGTFGSVELATNIENGRQVAIKYLSRGQFNPKYVERELLNHRLCSRHPHIINFLEVFVDEEHLGIVLEYAEGGDLFRYLLGKKRLDEDEARWFFQQLMFGVDFCHRCGIVNRDMKLENLLLSPYGDTDHYLLKICDFGYAKGADDSLPKSLVGTPEYIAPEVIAARAYDGQKADVWSCGVILYIMLTGKYPFTPTDERNVDPQAWMKHMFPKMMRQQYKVPDYLSDSCRDLISRMLWPEATSRIGVHEVMQHAWFQVDMPPGLALLNEALVRDPVKHKQAPEEIVATVQAATHRAVTPGYMQTTVNSWIEEELNKLTSLK